MKLIVRLSLMAFIVTAAASLSAEDQKHNTLTTEEKAAGWELLFDGETAKGWNSWKTKKPLVLGEWIATDGALSRDKPGGDIYTTEAFENFELSLEWKTQGNSGILFRVNPEAGGAIYKVAPEMQIERSGGKSSTSAGGLYALYEIQCEGEKVIHPDGWNHVRIRMVNGHGTHWFNGKQVADYQIGSDDWKERVAKSKFKNWEGFAETANGHIGLQEHGAKVSFRNIKIRRIEANQ